MFDIWPYLLEFDEFTAIEKLEEVTPFQFEKRNCYCGEGDGEGVVDSKAIAS